MKSLFWFLVLAPLILQSQVKSKSYNVLLNTLLKHSVKEITVDEAATKCNDYLLLDSREPSEYAVSHIQNARLVGFKAFNLMSVSDIPKNQKILVYCSVGYRSEKIAERLLEAGYSDVSNLYGGIFEWKNQKLEVVDSTGSITDDVHAYSKLWGIWLKEGNRVYD